MQPEESGRPASHPDGQGAGSGAAARHSGAPDNTTMERRAFLALLVAVSLLFLGLLQPFFSAIFWACVFAILFFPLQRRISQRIASPSAATLVTLFAGVAIGVLPAVFIFTSFIQEGAALYQKLQDGQVDPSRYIEQVRGAFPVVQELLDRFGLRLDALLEQLSGLALSGSRQLAQNAWQIGQNTLQFFVQLVIMLYLAFFALRDGPYLVELLIRALPIGDERERQLLNKFAEVTRATVKGNLVVAAVQGSLGGLIFWVLDIPGAVLWGVVMTVLSLIPVVGASLIWAPVAIYLFAVGDWQEGAVLVAFGAGVIGLVDNILRPILVGRDTKLPDFVVLLSTLGGFALFGMTGFVIGPLIAALFVAFWQIFMQEFYTGSGASPAQETDLPPGQPPSID